MTQADETRRRGEAAESSLRRREEELSREEAAVSNRQEAVSRREEASTRREIALSSKEEELLGGREKLSRWYRLKPKGVLLTKTPKTHFQTLTNTPL